MTTSQIRSERTMEGREQPSCWERTALAGGIAFSALQLAAEVFAFAAIFPQKPPLGAPVAEQAAWYAEHGTILAVGNYLLALPAPFFFLLFVGGLFVALRRAGGEALAVATAAAGTAMAMLWPLGCMLTNLGTTIAQNGGDAATVWALDGLAPLSLALSALPRAVLLGASSVVLLGGRLVPRWIGWSGLALGLISLLASGLLVASALFPALMLAQLLFVVWVAALSVTLFRNAGARNRVGEAHPRVRPAEA